jgi:clan AA aspartic protease
VDEVTPPFILAKVKVHGTKGAVELDARIDTGFDGDLTIPAHAAEPLGLVLKQQMAIELANGQRYLELLFDGEVEFLGERRAVAIYIFDRNEALIGNNLLRDCQLVIDYPSAKVNLFRTKSTQDN